MRLTPGQRLGPYQVVSVLGAGGMAEVYRARDIRLQRDVALKVVNEALASDPELVKRFEQEARVAGSLNHPNLVAVYDVGVQDDAPYFVTELLQGESLRQRMSHGRIPPGTALRWAAQMAQGLAAAHARGVIHRDVKPENAFVTTDGQVKLLDFGIAKLAERPVQAAGPRGLLDATVTPTGDGTRTGAVLGSPGYMSPEQVRGEPIDARTDLFSLGAVLHEMLSGQRAFPGSSLVESGYAILHADPAPLPPEVGAPLAQVVSRCLEKEPERRFQTARDLAFALEVLGGGSGPQTVPGKDAIRPRKQRGLWRPLAILLGLGLLAGAAAWKLRPAPETHLAQVEQITFREGTILSARFTPEGRVLFTGSWDGSPPQLYAHTPGSAELAPVGLANACVFSVSRSGELALSLHPRTFIRDECQGMLARVAGTGSTPREVMDGVTYADWSPSGQLAVIGSAGGKQRLEYPVGKTLYETGGWMTHARVSPSGDAVAFILHPVLPDDAGQVMLVDTAGKVRQLTKQWPRAEGLVWSPKGTEIWFTAGPLGRNGIWAVTPAGALREVFRNVSDLRLEDIAPDGTLLVTQQSWRQDIALFQRGQPGQRRLSWYDWASLADISADGTWLAFTQAAPVLLAEGVTPALTLVRKTDGSPAQILGEGYALAISPDARWVAASSKDYTQGVVVHPTGPGPSHVIETPGLEILRVRWFRDGKRLVAIGRPLDDAQFRVYLIDPGVAPPREISEPGIFPFLIDLSLDDRWVAVVGPTRATTLYPTAGGPAVPLPELGDLQPTGWSKDGHLWVKDRDKIPTRLVRFDVERRKIVEDLAISPEDPTGVVTVPRIRLTPDGKTMVYDYRRMLDYLYLVRGLGAEKH